MKKGDKVRFLSEVGGGVVAGFQSKDIVLVEDEDGFQIPMLVKDVVVVDDEDYSTSRIVAGANVPDGLKSRPKDEDDEDDPADRPVTFRAPAEERRGGDVLSAYLAFVPVEPKQMMTTRFEVYWVNDCNYYMRYTLLGAEGAAWKLFDQGEIDPNTKQYITEIGKEDLNDWERIAVQMLAYKKDKAFLVKPAVDVQFRVDTVKFYKLHTFSENDFFEQPALLYTIVENDVVARPLVVDAKKLKQEMAMKKRLDSQPARKADGQTRTDRNAPVVVDLHASELLESEAGMSSGDILNYQLDVFRKTLKEYEKRKGTKIVFIHGKGEGVLRQAIINELKYKYKQYTYQDASFQEYGYGATQVTIR